MAPGPRHGLTLANFAPGLQPRVMLTMLATILLAQTGTTDSPAPATVLDFEEPRRLLLDTGEPIDNGPHAAHGGPLWTDLDGDGHPDLLLGNLRGSIEVYGGLEDGTFTASGELEGASGKAIRLHNW